MAATLTTSGATIFKAGAGCATGLPDANVEQLINEAEAFLNVLCRYNWIDNYANLNADIQDILNEAASNLAAIYCIMYDMSSYSSRIEAEDMINILWARFQQCVAILKEQNSVTYMKGA